MRRLEVVNRIELRYDVVRMLALLFVRFVRATARSEDSQWWYGIGKVVRCMYSRLERGQGD
jgi:hypothetical protein